MDPSALDIIREADPDVLLVALGNPKQERWIRHFGPLLDVPVLIGVGGSFDFLTGRRRRAPLWMQRSGLEWVARAVQEPARLGPRYVLDAWVLGPRLLRQVWLDRDRRRGSLTPADITTVDSTVEIRVAESLDIQRHQEMRAALSDLSGTGNMRIHLSLPAGLDPTTVMSVVTILRSARRAGVPATIDGLPDGIALDVRTLLGRSTAAHGT
jgi:N-acetylglucosaminyldiphosphoundecaprenol N-acetyl-beta-D-mannosaminyltransferase